MTLQDIILLVGFMVIALIGFFSKTLFGVNLIFVGYLSFIIYGIVGLIRKRILIGSSFKPSVGLEAVAISLIWIVIWVAVYIFSDLL